MVRRTLLSTLALGALLFAFAGCGSSGDDETRGATRGAFFVVLPFVPTSAGEAVTLGFKNVTTTAAPAYVTVYMPGGGAYAPPSTYSVPAQGELRVSLATIVGGAPAGGFVLVDTRDIATPDPVTGEPTVLPTSGFVFPYIERGIAGAGAEADSVGGIAARSDEVKVAFTPRTGSVQLMNFSRMEMAGGSTPLAVTFDVDLIGADGTIISSTTTAVGGNASTTAFVTPAAGTVSSVRVRPMVPPAPGELRRFAIATRENGFHNHIEGRYSQVSDTALPGLLDLGFDVEFGLDTGGNVHDFGLLMCNGTTSGQTVTLRAVYRLGGMPVLTVPRLFSLRAGRTVFMGTTDTVSFGLEGGETSWFSDIFGDVFAATGFDAVTLHVQAPRGVDVSARHADASFASFFRVLPPIPQTNRACIFNLPVATSVASGIRSWVSITNVTSGELTVPVRAFTPLMGTEYILADIVVPPFSRLDWSPDGLQLREEPTATVGPFVNRLRLDMTPLTGALFNARVEARDAGGQLVWIRPAIVRGN